MKQYLIAFALLTGCGSAEEDKEETVELNAFDPKAFSSWSQGDRDALQSGCVDEAIHQIDTLGFDRTDAWAKDYCSCTSTEIRNRFHADDFIANEAQITETLVNDGTLERCINVAEEKTGDETTVTMRWQNGTRFTVDKITHETSAAQECAVGKLCRGMNAEEVHKVVGDPITVYREKSSIVGDWVTVWEWSEPTTSRTYCINGSFYERTNSDILDSCKIVFQEYAIDGEQVLLMNDVKDFQTEWLDILKY
jgi:hypothetical protein